MSNLPSQVPASSPQPGSILRQPLVGQVAISKVFFSTVKSAGSSTTTPMPLRFSFVASFMGTWWSLSPWQSWGFVYFCLDVMVDGGGGAAQDRREGSLLSPKTKRATSRR